MMKQGIGSGISSTSNKVRNVRLDLHHACLVGDDEDGEIFVYVRSLEQLFTDPDVDPWSPYEVEITGQSGLLMAIRHFETHKLSQPYVFRALIRLFTVFPQYFTGGALPFDPKRLVVFVPPEVMTEPDLAEQVSPVLVRYCELRIADLNLEIKRMRSLEMHLMVGGIGMFILFMFLWWILLYWPTDTYWTETFSQAFNVFAWIVIWHPFEAMIYDPIDSHRKIRAYKLLIAMDLEIRPQPDVATTEGSANDAVPAAQSTPPA
jgi:hypothetical protein